jgi:hypothetical protein
MQEWQCAYCSKWVSAKSPRHAHFAPAQDGGWFKTVYTREPSNAVRTYSTLNR